MVTLESLKHQFDIAITHLDSFFPLIGLTNNNSLENKDFEMLKEAIQTFNLNFTYYTMGNVKLDKVVSDSKLFLEVRVRKKFYQFAIEEYRTRRSHLGDIVSSMVNITPENVVKIEDIFFENFVAPLCH